MPQVMSVGCYRQMGKACHRLCACWRAATVQCRAAATLAWPSTIVQNCCVPRSLQLPHLIQQHLRQQGHCNFPHLLISPLIYVLLASRHNGGRARMDVK